jgi:hypothetical protein
MRVLSSCDGQRTTRTSGTVPLGVDSARQNLPQIVAGGQPTPNLSDGPQWGLTLGNAIRVWAQGPGSTRTVT